MISIEQVSKYGRVISVISSLLVDALIKGVGRFAKTSG